MLVLTRNIGGTIMLGDEIKVTVLSVEGDQVLIGIDYDKNAPINNSHRIINEMQLATEAQAFASEGVVTTLKEKGFGFCRLHQCDTTVFFHASDFLLGDFDALLKGSRISFTATPTAKGLVAKEISIIGIR